MHAPALLFHTQIICTYGDLNASNDIGWSPFKNPDDIGVYRALLTLEIALVLIFFVEKPFEQLSSCRTRKKIRILLPIKY